jgi:hypothetical protein
MWEFQRVNPHTQIASKMPNQKKVVNPSFSLVAKLEEENKLATIQLAIELRREYDCSGRTPISFDRALKVLEFAFSTQAFAAFRFIRPCIKGENFWKLWKHTYRRLENTYNIRKEIKKIFQSKETGRDSLMSPTDIKRLQGLPEKVTIYRGMTLRECHSGQLGVSWTLNQKIAELYCSDHDLNFPTYYERKCVFKLEIDKTEIIAYLNDRNEEEVIFLCPTLNDERRIVRARKKLNPVGNTK